MRYASISSRAQLKSNRSKGAIMTVQEKEQKARLAKFDQEALRIKMGEILEQAEHLEREESPKEIRKFKQTGCGTFAYFTDDKGRFLRWEK
jgi:hypothetical protein